MLCHITASAFIQLKVTVQHQVGLTSIGLIIYAVFTPCLFYCLCCTFFFFLKHCTEFCSDGCRILRLIIGKLSIYKLYIIPQTCSNACLTQRNNCSDCTFRNRIGILYYFPYTCINSCTVCFFRFAHYISICIIMGYSKIRISLRCIKNHYICVIRKFCTCLYRYRLF